MNIQSFKIPDLKLITLKAHGDSRGFFVERFKESEFAKNSLPTNFLQDNFSRSAQGVLRGLHFQWEKPQGKLVTCMAGHIFDVAVDIRSQSPTFGQYEAVELRGDRPEWFWIPAGFAHGFCVLSEQADIFYKCTSEYNPSCESGILWNDLDLQIPWPISSPALSQRDLNQSSFQLYAANPKFFYKDVAK